MFNYFKAKALEWAGDIDLAISDRYKSPIWTSFIISWLVLNWEIPLIILLPSEAGPDAIIGSVKAYTEANQYRVLALPALTSLLYSVSSGGLRMVFETMALLIRSKVESWKVSIMKNRTIPFGDYKELKDECTRLRQKEAIELDKLAEVRDENAKLTTDLESVEHQVTKLKDGIKTRDDQINALEVLKIDLESQIQQLNSKIGDNASVSRDEIEKITRDISGYAKQIADLIRSKESKSEMNSELLATSNNLKSIVEQMTTFLF